MRKTGSLLEQTDSTFFGCNISSTPDELVATLKSKLPAMERGNAFDPIGKKVWADFFFYHNLLMKEYDNNPYVKVLSNPDSC